MGWILCTAGKSGRCFSLFLHRFVHSHPPASYHMTATHHVQWKLWDMRNHLSFFTCISCCFICPLLHTSVHRYLRLLMSVWLTGERHHHPDPETPADYIPMDWWLNHCEESNWTLLTMDQPFSLVSLNSVLGWRPDLLQDLFLNQFDLFL